MDSLRGKSPASFNEAIPYRLAIAIGFTILYVALDRSVVFFQLWEGISAWYPPAGLPWRFSSDSISLMRRCS